jgi:polyhydroxybutyrate depolymerase
MHLRFARLTGLCLVTACGGDSSSPADAAPPTADAPTADAAPADAPPLPTTFGGNRPAQLLVPTSYDPATPMPLVVAMHGYSNNTSYEVAVLGLQDAYESQGFLLLIARGTLDATTGNYFWNATDACCDMLGSGVDDVAYIDGLLDEVGAAYNVDSKRVYAVGHSNGGFMAYRLACDSASRFAAVVSVSGATWDDPAKCNPSEPVSVLEVHSMTDQVIAYGGGSFMLQNGMTVSFPSAPGTVQRWSVYDQCAATTTTGAAIDVIGDATAETTDTRYEGCKAGIDAELWTIPDSPHLVIFKPGPPLLWNWLAAHPKP